jgi:hypothetical protein
VGGRHITHDIAYGLEIPPREAESIKIKYSNEPGDAVENPALEFLTQIIEARLQEIFKLVRQKFPESFWSQNPLIIATGGLSKTGGFTRLGKQILGNRLLTRYYPVPERNISIGAPWEALPIGLLQVACQDRTFSVSPKSQAAAPLLSLEKIAVTPSARAVPPPTTPESEPVISATRLTPKAPPVQPVAHGARPRFWHDLKAVFEEFF